MTEPLILKRAPVADARGGDGGAREELAACSEMSLTRVVAPFGGENSSLCFLDDFIGPLLLPYNLGNTIIVILNRRCSDYDGGFQAFKFARAASQSTIIG